MQAAQAPDSVTEGGAAIWSFKLLSLTIGELDISADDGFLEAIMSFIVSIPTADIWQVLKPPPKLSCNAIAGTATACGLFCLTSTACIRCHITATISCFCAICLSVSSYANAYRPHAQRLVAVEAQPHNICICLLAPVSTSSCMTGACSMSRLRRMLRGGSSRSGC